MHGFTENLKLIIADDVLETRRVIKKMLEAVPNISIIGEASTGRELVHLTLTEEPDILLVDIGMPDLDGMSAIKECLHILPQLTVIFITGFIEYAPEAFEIAACDYIMKPIEKHRLIFGIERAKKRVYELQQKNWQKKSGFLKKKKKLFFRMGQITNFIAIENILFIEKIGRKSLIHTREKISESNETLGAIMEKLDNHFFQVHRSYIVNLNHISSVQAVGDSYLLFFEDYSKHALVSRHRFPLMMKLIEGGD